MKKKRKPLDPGKLHAGVTARWGEVGDWLRDEPERLLSLKRNCARA